MKLELLGKLDIKGLMRSTRRTDLDRYMSSLMITRTLIRVSAALPVYNIGKLKKGKNIR